MMIYLTALLCPPLALVLIGRPIRAILATVLLAFAVHSWPSVHGLVLAALTMLWACRVVGDSRAKRELDGFLEVFHEARA
jgi:hypothetical protein